MIMYAGGDDTREQAACQDSRTGGTPEESAAHIGRATWPHPQLHFSTPPHQEDGHILSSHQQCTVLERECYSQIETTT